ncbi:DUF6221 family protein [Rhodococcus sp. NPDC056960]|uniref:DUF6221 family protein n=1 Tax=Rhodococcus sp. NPDC056960 TaxID=3345982 RepID=UPI0036299D7B
MNDIVEFLRARFDEDEVAAHAAKDSPIITSIARQNGKRAAAEHIARHNPARVRQDVNAKRTVLNVLEHWPSWTGPDGDLPARIALRHMAAVYADHPDYDPTWT